MSRVVTIASTIKNGNACQREHLLLGRFIWKKKQKHELKETSSSV